MVVPKNDEVNDYEAFLQRFRQSHPSAPPFQSSDVSDIADYVQEHAADGTADEWLRKLIDLYSSRDDRAGVSFGSLALMLGGLVVASIITAGVFFSEGFLPLLADPDVARGLVTFLFSFATIAVFVISAIAIFWVNPEEVDRRASYAKELLAVMIGVFGTILGFYFGSADERRAPVPATEVQTSDTAEDTVSQ